MAKKRTPSPAEPTPAPSPPPKGTRRARASPPTPAAPPGERASVTAERFKRLHQMLEFLSGGPKSRDRLTQHLGLDVRGFYRDLELLRASGIALALQKGEYGLVGTLAAAVDRLPFPDPRLTLGEARQLARGRSRAHQTLRAALEGFLA